MWNFSRFAAIATLVFAFSTGSSQAGPIGSGGTGSDLFREYLVIGTGAGTTGNEFTSFLQSNTEIGADQELISGSDNGSPSQRTGSLQSGSSLNLTGDLVATPNALATFGTGNRWDDVDFAHPNDTVGTPDLLPGARPIFEGIDFSGNVAITGALAKFSSSGSDVNADIGIQCKQSAAACFDSPSGSDPGNTYFSGPDPLASGVSLNALNGISQFNPDALKTQLANFRNFVNSLPTDIVFGADASVGLGAIVGAIGEDIEILSRNIKDDGVNGLFETDLDAIDAAGNSDGIAVIDIDVGDGGKFSVNTSDWILATDEGTFVIFRMTQGGFFDFDSSSIVLGGAGGTIQDWGALFFVDTLSDTDDTNQKFHLSDSILGGIALWDLVDFNPLYSDDITGSRTSTVLANSQGCAQFIGHNIDMQNNRWTRCSAGVTTDIPEPGTLALFGIGLVGLGYMRRRRKAA